MLAGVSVITNIVEEIMFDFPQSDSIAGSLPGGSRIYRNMPSGRAYLVPVNGTGNGTVSVKNPANKINHKYSFVKVSSC